VFDGHVARKRMAKFISDKGRGKAYDLRPLIRFELRSAMSAEAWLSSANTIDTDVIALFESTSCDIGKAEYKTWILRLCVAEAGLSCTVTWDD
jgi:hypothetical protein